MQDKTFPPSFLDSANSLPPYVKKSTQELSTVDADAYEA